MRENHFKNVNAMITTNITLRKPQRAAYKAVKSAIEKSEDTHKIVILPTGTGKTGLMRILPYGISNGRVLIITPSLIIREGISDEFDTRSPYNFWTEKNVIYNDDDLPNVYRYTGFGTSAADKKRVMGYLEESEIVIANIHKVYSTSSKKTLASLLDENFFDMIIIDEAHHAEADSWIKALDNFSAKKIIKLTATPFRSDLRELEGDIVYEYTMSDAISNKYIKNVIAEDFTTDHLTFEVDGEKMELDEAMEKMSVNWVSRSVAYSSDCNRTIVDMSINRLNEKRKHGNELHQIIAVACGVEHAKQLVGLYTEADLTCDYIVSERSTEECRQLIVDYKKGQLDVLINVNMLGEGFDNPNISIAAIFRPFRTLSPYAQFIGRALRRIPSSVEKDSINNIAHVVYHKELGLEKLWAYYAGEKAMADATDSVKREIEDYERNEKNLNVGTVLANGKVHTQTSEFLSDGVSVSYREMLAKMIKDKKNALKEHEIKFKKQGFDEETIKDLLATLARKDEEQINQKKEERRAELIREELHEDHRESIKSGVVLILQESGMDAKGTELPSNTSSSILKNTSSNEGYMIKYINNALKKNLRRGIDEWETYDFEQAQKELPILLERLKTKAVKLKEKLEV